MERKWESAKLGDYFDLIGGYAFKSEDFTESGVPVVKIKNVKSNRMLYDDLSYVDPEFLQTRSDKIVKRGDLLITMSGNRLDGTPETWVGKVAQFNEERPHLLNQRVGILRPKGGKEVSRRFFSYSLSSHFYQNEFIAIATSSGGQANLSPSQILCAPIDVPPLSQQKAIAEVLGALDDKIDVNRRMNANLETIARALFQSWFVDFDPVRAKVDGRQPAGLDPATASLFSNEFQDSELGRIPRDSRVDKVEDILTFNRATIDPSEFRGELFAHYSLPAFDEGRVPKLELGDAIKSHKLVVPSDAVLLSKLNPHIPRIWLPDVSADNRALCSTEFLVAQPKRSASREFLFCLFTSGPFESEYATLVTGTTGSHQRVKGETVLQMNIVIPSAALLERFSALAKPLFDKTSRNIRQSATLSTIRDTLLPKLLSGQLRIPSNN